MKGAEAYAFTNANLVIDPATSIASGTLLIKDGKIEQEGQNIQVPAGYIKIDLDGKYIYPGFIDMYTNYGLPKVEGPQRGGFGSA